MPKPSDSVTDLLRSEDDTHVQREVTRGSLEAQLEDLYSQRQELQRALGTADSRAIIAMVRSLEAQLRDLYTSLRGQTSHLSEDPR